ncbi:MAG TPA: hypothetical protein VK921_09335 [Anditalea sp.]|nr:hypothetical protein [Anditalea sp.]
MKLDQLGKDMSGIIPNAIILTSHITTTLKAKYSSHFPIRKETKSVAIANADRIITRTLLTKKQAIERASPHFGWQFVI